MSPPLRIVAGHLLPPLIWAATVLMPPSVRVLAALGDDPSEPIVFPAAANVADVTRPPYNATPDDGTDDTAAFQKALADEPRHTLIYVPDGTYLLSDTLRWGDKEKRQILQGQSRKGTILRLRDNAPGYTEAAVPKAMIWTGKRPAQRFRNGIRNLTLDIGRGNHGAIGAQFIANNQGGIQHVTIRSSDPAGREGFIGLDLGYTDEQGPCLIRHLTVEGFALGVSLRHAVNSVTLEFVELRGQRVSGIRNDGQVLSVRGLTSRNSVPAIHNLGPGSLTLLDSELVGVEGAADEPAILNEAVLLARGVRAVGYRRAVENRTGTRLHAEGPRVAEFLSHPVKRLGDHAPERSLNLPIRETPDVPWDAPETWASVTDFGPPVAVTFTRESDGKKFERTNWAPALQKAIDSGATTVYFPGGRADVEYGVYGPVHLRANLRRLIGCEAALSGIVQSNDQRSMFKESEAIPLFVLEEGQHPVVVVERFDTWYAAPGFEQKSDRTLVLRSLSFYELLTHPGTGDVFLEDTRAKKLRVDGSNVWARQLNPEGWEEPRMLIRGPGTLWVLGLKTESDTTVGQVVRGGLLEVCGSFNYANKNRISPKQLFINQGGTITAAFGEWVTRANAPFDLLEERHPDGRVLRMKKDQAYHRGTGSTAPLLSSRVESPTP